MSGITNLVSSQPAQAAPAQVNPFEARSARRLSTVSTASTISQAPRPATVYASHLPEDPDWCDERYAQGDSLVLAYNRISRFFSGISSFFSRIGNWVASFFVPTQEQIRAEREQIERDGYNPNTSPYIPPFVKWLLG